jgi:hypothetical protein
MNFFMLSIFRSDKNGGFTLTMLSHNPGSIANGAITASGLAIDIIDEWSSYLHMIEKLFNSSIKQPTGTFSNTLVFGGLIDANQGFLMTEPELKKQKQKHDPYGIIWTN